MPFGGSFGKVSQSEETQERSVQSERTIQSAPSLVTDGEVLELRTTPFSFFANRMYSRDRNRSRTVATFSSRSEFASNLGIGFTTAMFLSLTRSMSSKMTLSYSDLESAALEITKSLMDSASSLFSDRKVDEAMNLILAGSYLSNRLLTAKLMKPEYVARESKSHVIIANAKWREKRQGFYIGFSDGTRYLLMQDVKHPMWHLRDQQDNLIASWPSRWNWKRGQKFNMDRDVEVEVKSLNVLEIPIGKGTTLRTGLSTGDKLVLTGSPRTITLEQWSFLLYVTRSTDSPSLSLLILLPLFATVGKKLLPTEKRTNIYRGVLRFLNTLACAMKIKKDGCPPQPTEGTSSKRT
jgi:hypothetical protein